MIIKKFTAATETEAIMLAKEELGMDAIVMNIKKNIPKGIYRLFRKPTVEITAALDENIVYQQDRDEKQKKEPPKRNPNIIYDDDDAVELELSGNFDVQDKAGSEKSTAIEQKLNRLQDMLETQMAERSRTAEENREEGGEDKLEEDSNISCIRLIYNQMIANEVDEAYANQVIGEIENKLKKDAGVNNILMSMYQKIVLKLGQAKIIEVDEKKRKYIFFIGPTGVGKTTTIAKIASELKMNQKKRVMMLTADTYRIAAVEQLMTYANILEIPLKVVYSADEVKEAYEELEKNNNSDIVLVDTAGRSHKSREQRDDVEQLIKAIPEEQREVYLVLSATTKYRDLQRITDIYSEIADFALIFTKLDETGSIGNILNIHMKTGAPLSYATFGQNVPDDISVIDPQSIAKQLLGGSE